jgi:hypothetical protein
MKTTSSVHKTAPSKQLSSIADASAAHPPEPPVQSLGLSPDQLNDRAFSSSKVMNEILERDRDSYSFRHWGINE